MDCSEFASNTVLTETYASKHSVNNLKDHQRRRHLVNECSTNGQLGSGNCYVYLPRFCGGCIDGDMHCTKATDAAIHIQRNVIQELVFSSENEDIEHNNGDNDDDDDNDAERGDDG